MVHGSILKIYASFRFLLPSKIQWCYFNEVPVFSMWALKSSRVFHDFEFSI